MKFAPVPDAALREILAHSSKLPWRLASDEKGNFYIHVVGSEPLKVVTVFPYGTKGYDMRLMALAAELAAEVLELRQKVRNGN